MAVQPVGILLSFAVEGGVLLHFHPAEFRQEAEIVQGEERVEAEVGQDDIPAEESPVEGMDADGGPALTLEVPCQRPDGASLRRQVGVEGIRAQGRGIHAREHAMLSAHGVGADGCDKKVSADGMGDNVVVA